MPFPPRCLAPLVLGPKDGAHSVDTPSRRRERYSVAVLALHLASPTTLDEAGGHPDPQCPHSENGPVIPTSRGLPRGRV